ncbi:2-isopropylmalate synthase [Desulfolutivibrio sulfoxidireducens]|uniref:2-isopropylmalate synthase n=1 Tax=Desulfolutivibrio sulfoxidireducens TaxID=2773299 RepID=UPI00159DDDB6|nr:2-isopropylmalate synthase [Desulfolutivibrio sulfoxidireducens]QLA16671.1 2-isopropylmalate synthase [Desulfolutivibrio sulfoxidireducens]QLA19452.1 2-isopropylmalate synthase [Desulfolutivibrio sulfoxidireducens]
MSERVYIFDTTLRDGEQSPGATMTPQEKVRMARQLETLGVDIIEAGFPAASDGDFESVRMIAAAVKNVQVAALCRALTSDIDRGFAAIKDAVNPRIHTFIATSELHMKHKLGKAPHEVMDMAKAAVSHAASLTKNVEFSAEDASRSEPEFLAAMCELAIEAGATTVNIPDTVGYAQPAEFAELIRFLLGRVKNSRKAVFAVHCHNDLGLAAANTLAALAAGARQAEVTLSGIGERAGNAALEQVVMALRTRPNYYNLETGIDSEQIYPSCRLLSRVIGMPIPPYQSIIGRNAFAHESGIHQHGMLKDRRTYEIMTPQSIGRAGTEMVLGKHSGRHALKAKIEQLNYRLADDQIDAVFEAVKELADRKKQIYDEDVESLILEKIFRIPDKYRLKYLTVLSGNIEMSPSAAVLMEIDGVEVKTSAFGVGPVDAAFHAISDLTGKKPELDSYMVNAITGGADAQGEVTVRIRDGQKTSVGRGSHDDIIVASALAYLNALNRMAKKEEERECAAL